MPRKATQASPERKKPRKTGMDTKAKTKRLEKQLDALWAQIVKSQWKNKCGWPGCDRVESLTSHHFFGKKAYGKRARWNLNNGFCACFYHHIGRIHQQGDVEPAREAIVQQIGLDMFEQLKIDVQGIWKPTLDELTDLKEEFIAILDEIITTEAGI